jgi:hypothetical protein
MSYRYVCVHRSFPFGTLYILTILFYACIYASK